MNNRKVFLNSFLFLIFAFLPACSNTNAKQEVKKTAEEKPAIKQDAPHAEHKDPKDLPVLKAGDNLKSSISSIKVKTVKGKEKSLSNLMGEEKTLIAIVKPGCIYCESMLAIKSATGVTTKAKFLVVLDSSHADFEAFKEKHEKYKSAGGQWLFDINNDMENKFGVNSYPRFMLINKAGELEQLQIGLVMPENKEQFEGKSFPEILQALSEETLKWMSGI